MTVQNTPKKSNFYFLMPDLESGPQPGVVFENVKQLLTPPRLILRPNDGGFPPLTEVPRLVFDPKKGVMPRDLEAGFSGYWLISERLHQVFSTVDPEGFAFVECDFRMEDGSKGPRYFLCDVVRVLDALDEERSEVEIEVSDEFVEGKFYDFTGGARLAFRNDAVKEAHVFSLKYSGDCVFLDETMKDAVRKAGIGMNGNSDGLWLRDSSNWKDA
ncbi:DUF1629 domain-containing protein [Xanthomonas sp. WHRI 8391]|nr:DUF1629 domain-containing protein [Xanthomonas hortorum]ETC88314.1 hypothetical protein XHC_2173 [Xanthomonas hortorum pv. carotae str. M081]MBG3850783.1 DUF1629 domain-containing protein [Xanthomonas hortorum pv. carotae]MCC8553959.1 DUF1629 domain-containing protein [Xanthomonas hortorum pv. gardneri]MCE4364269.1 DUF1629 domain-containing protein [Xanthomonas hortorum]UTS72032.1 DUF1629 domain-containing protein [Xanthomonas hortorum]